MSNKNAHSTVSNKHTSTEVKTNVRKLDAKDFDPTVEHARYQSSVARKPVFLGKGEATITVDEDKALHRTLLHRYIHEDSIAIRLSKDDVFAKKDVGGKVARNGHTLILTIYEGPLPIPTGLSNFDYNAAFTMPQDEDGGFTSPKRMFAEWTKFKRSSVPAGRKYLESQRWFRIHGIQGNKDQVQYDTDNAMFKNKSAQFYLIPMDMLCFKQTLREALSLNIGNSSNGRAFSMTQQQFLDLGGQLKVEKADQAIRARKALSETDHVHVFPGLRVATEPTSRICLDQNIGPVVELKSQTSVYLRSEYMTLSDFVAQHYRADLHSLQSSGGVKMLTASLRGVVVKLGSSNERRMVMGFKMVQSPTCPRADCPTLRHLHTCLRRCLSSTRALRGPRGAGLNHYINFLTHGEADMRLPESCETAKASLVFHQIPKNTDMGARFQKACDDKPPNLLFVEVGSAAVHSKSWSELRNALTKQLQQSPNFANSLSVKRAVSMSLLSLRYDPKSDLSTQRTRQLRDFVTQCEKPGQKTIFIVWLEPEQDQNMMYNILKTACDVYVGAQTFFVRRGTFESQIHNATKKPNVVDPITRYAIDVGRRICQKNPGMLQEQISGYETQRVEIAIAMHVSPVYVAPKRVSQAGRQHDKPDIYLVTFVSRDPTQSKNYRTEQGLFSRSQIMSDEHVELLSAFTSKLSSQIGDIIIMRSGVLSFGQEETGTSDDTIDLTNSASFRSFDAKRTNGRLNAPDQKTQVHLPTPTSEMHAINKHFPTIQGSEGPRNLTYVTLTENDTFSTRVDTSAYKGNDNCSAMLFVVGSDSLSVNIQQIPRVPSASNLKKAVGVRPGAITATFRRAWQKNVVNLAATSAQGQNSNTLSHDMENLKLASKVDSKEVEDPLRVADTDVDFLAAIWTDDGLGLCSTKWPIPTHLARLAAKRAMLRLRTDDWQNEHTAPFSLPDVHEKVRNTLYYL